MASPAELGRGDLRKLLLAYSGPAILAMMASSIYNIIDSIFIGHGVGALALSGLAITMPIMNLSAAFGAMVGAGGATLTSIKMGQQDYDGATHVLGNVVTLNLILGFALMFLGLFFIDELLYLFGASSETIPYARDFMQIILIGNPITHLYLGLNNEIRASGYPQKAMRITLLTVVINAVLAPIFIFSFNWGIRGAALATVLAQTVALIIVIIHLSNKNNFLHFKRGTFSINKRITSGILSIGMAPFTLHTCSCIIVILINNQLAKHGGDMAVGAYGVVNRLVMFFATVVMGLNQGMQPIAGFNYGAQIYSRVRKVLKLTILFGILVMTVAFALGETIPGLLVKMFTNDEELITQSTLGLRITVIIFPLVGFQMVTSNFFQSIGKAPTAVLLSASRLLLILIPLLAILPNYLGTLGVWISMPISDGLSTILSFILLKREMKKFKKLEDKPFSLPDEPSN